jgi:hypothetical protein
VKRRSLYDVRVTVELPDDKKHAVIYVVPAVCDRADEAITDDDLEPYTSDDWKQACLYFTAILAQLVDKVVNRVEGEARIHACRKVNITAIVPDEVGNYGRSLSGVRNPEPLADNEVVTIGREGCGTDMWFEVAPHVTITVPRPLRQKWKERVEANLNALFEAAA